MSGERRVGVGYGGRASVHDLLLVFTTVGRMTAMHYRYVCSVLVSLNCSAVSAPFPYGLHTIS